MPRWWYIFPFLVSAFGILIAVGIVDSRNQSASELLLRVKVPDRQEVELHRAGTWLLFNEITFSDGHRLEESGAQHGLLARVEAETGLPLKLEPSDGSLAYALGGQNAVAVARFEVDQPGSIAVEGFYLDEMEHEPGMFVLVHHDDMAQLDIPSWPIWIATTLVLLSIGAAGWICHGRIRTLVDYESRAVPTMTSTTMPASFWRRAAATALDFVIVIGTLMILTPWLRPFFDAMTHSSSIWTRLILFLLFLGLLLAYFVVPEARFGGTPGKFVMSLRTVTAEGRRLGFERSLVRNLFRVIDFLPIGYIVGAVAHWTSKDNRRLGDIVADSLVVER